MQGNKTGEMGIIGTSRDQTAQERSYSNDHGIDIPGPVDWEQASHWVHYDHDSLTVETWCKTGPNYAFRLRTRVRPMVECEIIHSKLRGHDRESIRMAYSFPDDPVYQPIRKKSLFQKIRSIFIHE